MSNNAKIIPLLSPDALFAAQQRFREKMGRDAEQVWNALVALACYGPNGIPDAQAQLAAQKTVLAYTLGLPVERMEVNTEKRTGVRILKDATDAELEAMKVLRDAQRQRELDDGEGDE